MNSNHVKAVIITFVLLFTISFITVGCKQEQKNSWVNTSSMPGNTFTNHNNRSAENSAIVYLGGESSSTKKSDGFGPRDVSFEFSNLR